MNCVEHKQAGNKAGYGYSRRKIDGKYVNLGLHVIAYCEANGLPLDYTKRNGLEIRHSCHNARCINPAHLDVGSHAENMLDQRKRYVTKFDRTNGKLTEEERLAIMELKGSGMTQTEVAQRFNVTQTLISYMWRKKRVR